MKINTICNFSAMKGAVELNRLIIVMLGIYSRKFSRIPCKIQLSRGNLGEQKVLESAFSGFHGA